MVTQRQAQSNRANARFSTGPISAAGKAKSSKNARSHGLSVPIRESEAIAAAKVFALSISNLVNMDSPACYEFALLEREIQRIRQLRAEICRTLDTDVSGLKTLIAIARYQREAESKQRRLLERGIKNGT